jgi:hypothetical protein
MILAIFIHLDICITNSIVLYRTFCKAFLHLLVCCADSGVRKPDAAWIRLLPLP